MKNLIIPSTPRSPHRDSIQNLKIIQGILDAGTSSKVPLWEPDPEALASFIFDETPEEEMVGEFKEGKINDRFTIDAFNTPDFDCEPLYGRSSDPNNPSEIFVKDPRKTSQNNFALLRDNSSDEDEIIDCQIFTLEDDKFETPEQISAYIREVNIQQFKHDIQMDDMDAISKETANLDMQLNILGGSKINKYESLTQSLQEADRIINLERQSQLLKMFQDLARRGPYNEFDDNCDVYYESLSTLDPDDQKAFRSANEKLQQAVTILTDPDAVNHTLNAEMNVRDLLLDALTLWPSFKQDERVNQLVLRVLDVTSCERRQTT